MLYQLFTTYEMHFLAKYSPKKTLKNPTNPKNQKIKHLNFVTGDGDQTNGDAAFSYDFIAVR